MKLRNRAGLEMVPCSQALPEGQDVMRNHTLSTSDLRQLCYNNIFEKLELHLRPELLFQYQSPDYFTVKQKETPLNANLFFGGMIPAKPGDSHLFINEAEIAEDGFDPSTSGLWAQHASAAPLCYTLQLLTPALHISQHSGLVLSDVKSGNHEAFSA